MVAVISVVCKFWISSKNLQRYSPAVSVLQTLRQTTPCYYKMGVYLLNLTLFISRFCGFRSLCSTLLLWQKARPLSNWYMNDWKYRQHQFKLLHVLLSFSNQFIIMMMVKNEFSTYIITYISLSPSPILFWEVNLVNIMWWCSG